MDLTHLIEIFLKAVSVGSLFAASTVILLSLLDGRLRPRAVWCFSLSVVLVSAIWRVTATFSPVPEDFWAQEVNHGVYTAIGFAFLSLAMAGRRTRAEDAF